MIGTTLRMLLDPLAMESLLREALAIEWPSGDRPCHVRVERCWPLGPDGFSFEWSFELTGGRRYALHGVCPIPAVATGVDSTHLTLTPAGLCRVRIQIPALNLLIHSADCDPHMPHLARCLDPGQMSAPLSPWLPVPDHRTASQDNRLGLVCRPVSYRAGRRAAIAYRNPRARGGAHRVFGKSYRNGRGARLIRVHDQLNEHWRSQFGSRAAVPRPLGFLPDLHMAVFEWVGDNCRRAAPADERAFAALDVLSALHRTPMDGLTAFTVADECAIIRRWHAALVLADPPSAERTCWLRDALLQGAEGSAGEPPCTIHRDFYGRQVRIAARTTTLVDLDTLAQGAPSVDVGNLVAHTIFDQLVAGAAVDQWPAIGNPWVERYERLHRRLDRRSLAFHTASALFRVGAVHALRSATRCHASTLWQLAAFQMSHHTRSRLSAAPQRMEKKDGSAHLQTARSRSAPAR